MPFVMSYRAKTMMTRDTSRHCDMTIRTYNKIIAYLIKYLMMGMRTVVSAMSQIHVSLEESSKDEQSMNKNS